MRSELGFSLLVCFARNVSEANAQPYISILSKASKLSSDRPSQYVRQAGDSLVLQKVPTCPVLTNIPDNSGSLIDLLTTGEPDPSRIPYHTFLESKMRSNHHYIRNCSTKLRYPMSSINMAYFSLHLK
jgi:hypothetical protein